MIEAEWIVPAWATGDDWSALPLAWDPGEAVQGDIYEGADT
jgi:hypothetical protein